MKKIISTYVNENDALIFEKNINFFTKKHTIKVYLQENIIIRTITKNGNTTKEVIKDNPNAKKPIFLYEIKGNQADIFNFIKLIKNDFDKRCKYHNYTSILYY